MRSLVQLIFRYHVFLLFIAFEIAALTLLFNTNRYHHTAYFNSANDVIGGILTKRSSLREFWRLSEENDSLALQIALLQDRQPTSFYTVGESLAMVNDTLRKQHFLHTSAKVVNKSTNKKRNYLTINRGTNHGLEEDMGVIANGAVVGQVLETGSNFSVVLPLINPNFSVPAQLGKNGVDGYITWDGESPQLVSLTEVPIHVKVNPGDTIFSNSYSGYFPPEMVVGTVQKSQIPAGEPYQEIWVNLAVDFNELHYVEVVKNFLKDEQQELEKGFYNAEND